MKMELAGGSGLVGTDSNLPDSLPRSLPLPDLPDHPRRDLAFNNYNRPSSRRTHATTFSAYHRSLRLIVRVGLGLSGVETSRVMSSRREVKSGTRVSSWARRTRAASSGRCNNRPTTFRTESAKESF